MFDGGKHSEKVVFAFRAASQHEKHCLRTGCFLPQKPEEWQRRDLRKSRRLSPWESDRLKAEKGLND